jgi:hypothetical protein
MPFAVIFVSMQLAGIADLLFFESFGGLNKKLDKLLSVDLSLEGLLAMDKDGDGEITEFEFLRFMLSESGLAPASLLDHLHLQFGAMDQDGSGCLDAKDLAVEPLGIPRRDCRGLKVAAVATTESAWARAVAAADPALRERARALAALAASRPERFGGGPLGGGRGGAVEAKENEEGTPEATPEALALAAGALPRLLAKSTPEPVHRKEGRLCAAAPSAAALAPRVLPPPLPGLSSEWGGDPLPPDSSVAGSSSAGSFSASSLTSAALPRFGAVRKPSGARPTALLRVSSGSTSLSSHSSHSSQAIGKSSPGDNDCHNGDGPASPLGPALKGGALAGALSQATVAESCTGGSRAASRQNSSRGPSPMARPGAAPRSGPGRSMRPSSGVASARRSNASSPSSSFSSHTAGASSRTSSSARSNRTWTTVTAAASSGRCAVGLNEEAQSARAPGSRAQFASRTGSSVSYSRASSTALDVEMV